MIRRGLVFYCFKRFKYTLLASRAFYRPFRQNQVNRAFAFITGHFSFSLNIPEPDIINRMKRRLVFNYNVFLFLITTRAIDLCNQPVNRLRNAARIALSTEFPRVISIIRPRPACLYEIVAMTARVFIMFHKPPVMGNLNFHSAFRNLHSAILNCPYGCYLQTGISFFHKHQENHPLKSLSVCISF